MSDLRKISLAESTVRIERLDTDIRIRELMASDLVDIQSAYQSLNGQSTESENAAEMYYMLVAQSVVNDDGDRYLAEDIAAVKRLPWPVVLDIAHAALELNGMVDKEKKS